jgi:septum formation protein
VDGRVREVVVVTTRVHFRALSEATRARYVALGEGRDKAGGYGIQGVAGAFVERIEGSYSNVVGLPLAQTVELLTRRSAADLTASPARGRA